jgi:acyl carrier protein
VTTTPDWSAEILAIFREVLAIEIDSTEVDVIDSGVLDSLALVTLLFELEQRTGLEFPLDRVGLDDLRTVSSMAGVVARAYDQAA